MISYVCVLALLIGVAIGRSSAVTFTAPNAIAEELGIPKGVRSRAIQKDSERYGGTGGVEFNSPVGLVTSIRIYSSNQINSIQLEYQNGKTSGYYGGTGGSLTEIHLANNEDVVTILGRYGLQIYSLTFITNLGRTFGPYGGNDGNSFQVSECNMKGIFGRSGSMIDAIGFHC